MRWVIFTERAGAHPRSVLVKTLLALGAVLSGCGEEPGSPEEWAKPIFSSGRKTLKAPVPENRLDPVPLSGRAVLEGYTLMAVDGLAPGSVVEATLCYRSLLRQDGEFQVTVHLLGSGKELDTAATFVSTARWPRQKEYLEKDEVFWGTVSLRLPLGFRTTDFEIVAILGTIDEDNRKVQPIPPPIRFTP